MAISDHTVTKAYQVLGIKDYTVDLIHAIKTHGKWRLYFQSFQTLALDGGEVTFMHQLIYPWGKSTWYPLNR